MVDASRALVGSAELSALEQDATIEAGALITDRGYVAALREEWQRLIDAGQLGSVTE